MTAGRDPSDREDQGENYGPSFRLGDRVRVRRDAVWAQGATGTVAPAPEFIDTVMGAPKNERYAQRAFRTVETTSGPEAMYWVALDEAQLDAEGDGPYAAGEFLDRYLEAVNPE